MVLCGFGRLGVYKFNRAFPCHDSSFLLPVLSDFICLLFYVFYKRLVEFILSHFSKCLLSAYQYGVLLQPSMRFLFSLT
jgi:hypothetical protein